MGPGNRKAKECDYIFCGVSVPGVVPAGAHVHVEGIGDADSFKLIHKVGKVNHVHRINDAEISVELRKGPVAAGSWSFKVLTSVLLFMRPNCIKPLPPASAASFIAASLLSKSNLKYPSYEINAAEASVRKSTRLNSSHIATSRMPSSA